MDVAIVAEACVGTDSSRKLPQGALPCAEGMGRCQVQPEALVAVPER